MDSMPEFAFFLAGGKSIQKRPSNGAFETQDPQKRHLVDLRTPHAAVLFATTGDAVQDPHITADQDSRSVSRESDQVKRFQKQIRIYKEPNRRGEPEISAWGLCCQCETGGLIMSWPKCRSCFRNRCQWCEYSEESTTFDREEAGEKTMISTRFNKMNELSGEIALELEALEQELLGGDETCSQQSDEIGKVLEALKVLNQCLSEAEDDGSEGVKLEDTPD